MTIYFSTLVEHIWKYKIMARKDTHPPDNNHLQSEQADGSSGDFIS